MTVAKKPIKTKQPVAASFDEEAECASLVTKGLELSVAREIASKMAEMRRQAIEESEYKAKLVLAGMPEQAAKETAAAKTLFSKSPEPPAPTTALIHGFQAFGDVVKTSGIRPQRVARVVRPLTLAAEDQVQQEPPPEKIYDYRQGALPKRERELIETHLAIEAEDAKSAGSLGFMTRSLAIATLPHRRTPDFRFVRRNGDFSLTMITAHPEGLPFGTLPRLLLTWVCTEAARKGDRVLDLGPNLAGYLRELGLHPTGGKKGDITRLKHAMTTLFSAVISCSYAGRDAFALQNVLLADSVHWWKPQSPDEAGEWQSKLMLSEPFFKECIDHKLPFDMRAMRALRQSPLALDIYVWLTHRMSYLSKRTLIPWVALAGQFGSGYATDVQGIRDFKRAFLRELKRVQLIYPAAKCSDDPKGNGLVLYPSPTHVSSRSSRQPSLPFD